MLPDGTPVQIPLSAELEPNQTLVVPVKVPKKMPTVLNPVSDVDKKDEIFYKNHYHKPLLRKRTK